jgi:hypothetical protein
MTKIMRLRTRTVVTNPAMCCSVDGVAASEAIDVCRMGGWSGENKTARGYPRAVRESVVAVDCYARARLRPHPVNRVASESSFRKFAAGVGVIVATLAIRRSASSVPCDR